MVRELEIDQGFARLLDGTVVPLYDIRIEVIGTLDEVSASIGLVRACAKSKLLRERLMDVQRDIYQIMCELSDPSGSVISARIDSQRVNVLEKENLGELSSLESPEEIAFLNYALQKACTIAERAGVLAHELNEESPISNEIILHYISQLPGYLHSCTQERDILDEA